MASAGEAGREGEPAMGSWTGRRLWVGLLAVWLVHACVVFYVLPPRFALSEQPILFADYTHNLRTCLLYLRLGNGAAQWAYDPYQMAGILSFACISSVLGALLAIKRSFDA